MAKEMLIFIDVKPANITKSYDSKLKPKLIAEIAKTAKKAINKNPKMSASKPTGWKKETDKGVTLNIQLVSLTKTEVKKELHIKASVALSIASTKKATMNPHRAIGSATVKIQIKNAKPDGDAIFIAGHAVATL